MLRERSEIRIAQPHEERRSGLVEEAGVSAQSLVALESKAAFDQERLELAAVEGESLNERAAGEFYI